MQYKIFYKAKTENDDWHSGLLCHEGHAFFISNKAGVPRAFEVLRDTISYCANINEREIAENEVYSWIDLAYGKCIGIIKFGEYEQDGSGGEYSPTKCYGFFVEIIKVEPFGWSEETEEEANEYYPDYLKTISVYEMLEKEKVRLIGNVFDEPGLIKEVSLL